MLEASKSKQPVKYADSLKALNRRDIIQKLRPKNSDNWGEEYSVPQVPFNKLVQTNREPEREEPIIKK